MTEPKLVSSIGGPPDDAEGVYRQAYTHGAESVLSAIEPFMPPAQMARLHAWATGDLRQWRFHLDRHPRVAPPAIDI
jgi:hypothetical protein